MIGVLDTVVVTVWRLRKRPAAKQYRFATGGCWMPIMLVFRVNLQQNSRVKLNTREGS
jgi:hypothetical protein